VLPQFRMLKMGGNGSQKPGEDRNGSGERSMMSVSRLSLDVNLVWFCYLILGGWGCRFYDPLLSPQTCVLEIQ
jgi:hypothetical protein